MNRYAVPAEPISIQDVHTSPPLVPSKPFADSSRLAPGNAFFPPPPPRLHAEAETIARTVNEAPTAGSSSYDRRRKRDKDRGRSGSRRGKGEWKKLLWVKQPKCKQASNPLAFLPLTTGPQIPIITPTHRLSSPICSATPGFSPMTSGPSWPTRPSSCSILLLSPSSSAVSWVSTANSFLQSRW